jgi:hypothetical protein
MFESCWHTAVFIFVSDGGGGEEGTEGDAILESMKNVSMGKADWLAHGEL